MSAQLPDGPHLRRLRGLVNESNPTLRILRANLAAADARARAAGYSPAMVAELEIEDVPGGLDLPAAGSIRLDVWKQVPNAARRSAQRAAGQIERETAELGMTAGARWIEARLSHAILRGAGEALVARRLAAEDSLLAEAEESLREKLAVGGARYLDVLRLRTERLRIQSELHTAATAARIARQQLVAMATSAEVELSTEGIVDSALAESMRADPADAPPQALGFDSLIAAASTVWRADLNARGATVAADLIRANQRPDIAAGLGFQRFAGESGGHQVGPTIGVSVSLPFTARRGNQLALEAAELEVAAAAAAHNGAIAHARATMSIRAERFEALRQQLARYDTTLLIGASEERETALSAYRNGTITLLDFLDFERALRHAEVEVLRLRISAAAALVELYSGVFAPASDDSDSLDAGATP